MTEPAEQIMEFFAYAHLPETLQRVSAPFGVLANVVLKECPRSAERTVALRKLLEGKDAAVRAMLVTPVPFRERESGAVDVPRVEPTTPAARLRVLAEVCTFSEADRAALTAGAEALERA